MRTRQLTRRTILFLIAAWAALASPLGEWSAPIARAADAPPYHLVVLGDPHLPGKFLPAKERVLQTINAWADLDAVVVLGDICEDAGTAVEYAAAKQFFATLTKPVFFIAGNHDYFYEESPGVSLGRRPLACLGHERELPVGRQPLRAAGDHHPRDGHEPRADLDELAVLLSRPCRGEDL